MKTKMEMKCPCSSKCLRSAFTLVELMVALMVAGALVALISAITIQAASVWQRLSGRIATRAQADLIFDRIAQDIEGAVFKRDGNVWMAATFQSAPQVGRGDASMADAAWEGRVKPAAESPGDPSSSLYVPAEGEPLSKSRFGQAGVWFRFFTTQPDAQSSLHNLSAPRAVGYQIVRRRLTASATAPTNSHTPVRYLLYRSSARPANDDWDDRDSTFGVGYDLFSSSTPPNYNRGDAGRIDNVGNLRTPRRYEQVLGNNVIDFGVRCWVREDATGKLVQRFPMRMPERTPVRGFAATVNDGRLRPAAIPPTVGTESTFGAADMAYGFPSRIDVMVRILTEEGARMIEAFESGRVVRTAGFEDDGSYWWSLAAKHSHVYVSHIQVLSHAL